MYTPDVSYVPVCGMDHKKRGSLFLRDSPETLQEIILNVKGYNFYLFYIIYIFCHYSIAATHFESKVASTSTYIYRLQTYPFFPSFFFVEVLKVDVGHIRESVFGIEFFSIFSCEYLVDRPACLIKSLEL